MAGGPRSLCVALPAAFAGLHSATAALAGDIPRHDHRAGGAADADGRFGIGRHDGSRAASCAAVPARAVRLQQHHTLAHLYRVSFARAVTATKLGLRVAYLFIERFGHSSLTLGYSIVATDALLAVFIPSDTARGGGIVFPIVRSLAQVFDSEPGPTAKRIGSFLILVGFHATYTGSAMFLTGMAANPLIAEFAMKIAHVELTWGRWAAAAALPGCLSLIIVPYLLYKLAPPEIHDTSAARVLARKELDAMGPLSRNERWLVAILVGVMIGWITSSYTGVPNTFVALGGLCAILLTRVLTWDELLSETRAWDALIWFAPLLMMADAMQELGVIKVLSSSIFGSLAGWNWLAAMAVLLLVYLYIHYAFASMTAHVTALYPGFLTAAIATGAPALMAALPLAFFSNLNAGLYALWEQGPPRCILIRDTLLRRNGGSWAF